MATDVRPRLNATRVGEPAEPERNPFGRAEGRAFALPVGGAFVALSALLWWRGHTPAAAVLGAAGLLLALAGVLAPSRLGPLHRAWMTLAVVISKITTPVFMSVVYYLVLTPTGLLRRTLGRNPLRRAERGGTYWVSRTKKPESDLTRQF